MSRTSTSEVLTSDDKLLCLTQEESEIPETPAETSKGVGLGALAVAAPLLAACGGSGGSGTGSEASGRTFSATMGIAAAPISDADAARFLLKAQFSASSVDIAAVKAQGYAAWLSAQYDAAIGTKAWDWLNNQGYGTMAADRMYRQNYPADYAIWNQLIAPHDQVRKRLCLALSELFVAPIDSAHTWSSHLSMAYWDMLNTYVFGNYRTLLEQVTLSPNMGYFLSLIGSAKANPVTGSQPDENYAREIMQLFTIGLYQLNSDGTRVTDTSGNTLDTFSQSDITNLARVFTGYQPDVSTSTSVKLSWEASPIYTYYYTRRPMALNPKLHSPEAVSFLGVNIAANTDGAVKLKVALDTLFNHANTGPFFARQMIQRLVTSNPSPAYVGRVAAVFANNGSGVRGDLRAVWTAILTDPEAIAPQDAVKGGKLREPVVRFVQWARTAEVTSTNGVWSLYDMISPNAALGQSPMRSPSVFNFFQPDYTPPNTQIAARQQVAPEFQLLDETSTAAYLNFMLPVVQKGIRDVVPQYTTALSVASDATALTNWLNLRMTGNQLSANTVTTIRSALAAISASTAAGKLLRVQGGMYLVMSCPEYLIQK